MDKELLFKEEAKNKLKAGAEKLYDAVSATLGPGGRNVLIETEYHKPVITKDGVTVAKSINLPDSVENMGCEIIKEAAIQTGDVAGDGTTTATILAYEILKLALYHIQQRQCNPIEVKRGIDLAVKDIVEQLKQYKKDIKTTEEIIQVGTVSANNDVEIGNLISAAMNKVGLDGVITVEESKRNETTLEVVEGMQFERGYLSPYFITNNAEMQVELKDPYILIYNHKLSSMTKEFIKVLEQVITKQKSLLIIADDVDGEALAGLVVNKMRGTINVCAVKAPDFGAKRSAILEDIAILTNGTVITPEKGITLDKFDISFLGQAKRVVVTSKETTIISGAGDADKIESRINEIKSAIDISDSAYDKERMQERLAKLAGGVAILNIGAETETELKEKKDRVDDALHATRAALEEGILPGGGIALYKISKSIEKSNKRAFSSLDQSTGYDITIKAIQQPFLKLIANAGLNNFDIIPELKNTDYSVGCNIRTSDIVDMYEAGIIDPVKVIKIALQKAASAAGMLLTTEAVVTNIIDKTKKEEYAEPAGYQY